MNVKAIKRRFLALNHDRIERTRDSLREHQRDVLDLLPLFFHVNHPLLPGFISKDVPFGIADYQPGKAVKEAAIRLSKGFEYKRRPLIQYGITSVFLMGSSGTVAYSDKSDFDVWVCHQPSLSKAALALLSQKAEAIEAWADSIGIEINIYLMNPEQFRKGQMSDLSGESSGSAQYHLLLDEFYRTSLLLAGCYPLWWLVPPEEEHDYEAVAHKLKHHRFVKEGECIDFGGLSSIPLQEFFGASLWQLFKAIDSPYKSVLKLLLMEVYAKNNSDADLLSRRYKQAVYEGASDLTKLDPYVMLYAKLEEYLLTFGGEERIDLLRRCFYFKVNLRLSYYGRIRRLNWRWEYMAEAVKSWGWDERYLKILDARNDWKMHRVMDERKILINELTHCYRFISDFVRNNEVTSSIKQQDLNLLGRKLFSTYERKAGKIEIINHGISANLWERRLSLHCSINKAGTTIWSLYAGTVDMSQVATVLPVRSASTVLELVAWAYFNKILDASSGISVYSGASGLTIRELSAIIDVVHTTFSSFSLSSSRTSEYSQSSHIVDAIVVANVGIDPMTSITGEGKQLMTNQTNALCYSGMHHNLVKSLDMVVTTSWGEVLTHHFSGQSGVLDCLCEYARLAVPARYSALPFSCRSFSSARGMMIGLRIERLFKDVINCFYADKKAPKRQYIIVIADDYYALTMKEDVLSYDHIGDFNKLIEHLATVHTEFVETIIDRFSLNGTLLPLIYKQNRSDEIQLFYSIRGEQADVYVIDELGALFHQRVECSSSQFLLRHFSELFEAIEQRNLAHRDAMRKAIVVSYHEIVGGGASSRKLVKKHYMRQSGDDSVKASLQVIGNRIGDTDLQLRVFCGGREFSTLDSGENLFQDVADHIVAIRKPSKLYPIHISDLDMPASVLLAKENLKYPATSHYLVYKKQLEQSLNDALASAHQQALPSSA